MTNTVDLPLTSTAAPCHRPRIAIAPTDPVTPPANASRSCAVSGTTERDQPATSESPLGNPAGHLKCGMPERQFLRRIRNVAGASLNLSTTGGYSVHFDGAYIGYIHASVGDRWNTYLRRVDALADYLGKFGQEEAVQRIVQAFAEGGQIAGALIRDYGAARSTSLPHPPLSESTAVTPDGLPPAVSHAPIIPFPCSSRSV